MAPLIASADNSNSIKFNVHVKVCYVVILLPVVLPCRLIQHWTCFVLVVGLPCHRHRRHTVRLQGRLSSNISNSSGTKKQQKMSCIHSHRCCCHHLLRCRPLSTPFCRHWFTTYRHTRTYNNIIHRRTFIRPQGQQTGVTITSTRSCRTPTQFPWPPESLLFMFLFLLQHLYMTSKLPTPPHLPKNSHVSTHFTGGQHND